MRTLRAPARGKENVDLRSCGAGRGTHNRITDVVRLPQDLDLASYVVTASKSVSINNPEDLETQNKTAY